VPRRPFPVVAFTLAASSAAAGPFLEPDVEVIYEVAGEFEQAQFGFVSDVLSDLNGDGIPEWLTSAPFAPVSGQIRGRVYLMDGLTGAVLRTHLGTTPQAAFGWRMAGLGDLDGDGIEDYGASAPGTTGSTVSGEVTIWSGNLSLSPDQWVLWTSPSEGAGDRFGHALDGVGDVNGDGRDDFLVGAPQHDTGGANAGRARIYSGLDWTVLRTHDGSANAELLGHSGGTVGDVTGDGVDDYIIGAPGWGPGRRGAAWVFSGATGDTLYQVAPDSPFANNFAQYFANSPGDMNGDGVNDLFVSDFLDTTHGTNTGRVYAYDGVTGAMFPYQIAGENARDWTGFGGRWAGDLDQDGCADFVTNFIHNPETGASFAGKVVVVSGKTGATLRTITSLNTGEWFGYDCTGFPDVNGDGIPEILVCAGPNSDVAPAAGKAYLIAGRAPAVEVAGAGATLPAIALHAAPNPFRSGLTLDLGPDAAAGPFRITIYDAGGRRLRRLHEGTPATGRIGWDGRDADGRPVAPGVYFVEVRSPVGVTTRRVTRLR